MTIKELRTKSVSELQDLSRQLKSERQQLEFAIFAQQERNVRKLRNIKRDLARVLTALAATPRT